MISTANAQTEFQKELDDVENYMPSLENREKWGYFFTEKILKWVSKETDSYCLSLTSHLLNCHVWPSWLPDMPDGFYNEKEKWLHESVMLMHILKRKSNALSPGIYNMIWAARLYQKHPEYQKHNI